MSLKGKRMVDLFQTSGNSPTSQEQESSLPTPDFRLLIDVPRPSLLLLIPVTDVARAWVEENNGGGNGFQPYFPNIVVEHSDIADILKGIHQSGLTVQP